MTSLIPVATVATSLVAGIAIFALPEERVLARSALNLAAAAAKLALVGVMLVGVSQGTTFSASLPLLPGVALELEADPISLLFASLSALLWLLTTIYAIGYMETEPHRSRFFGFFALSVAATTGVALAGNLLTLFVFYEALTLATYPLVVHRGTPAALAAGRTYLAYTLGGGAAVLAGTLLLSAAVGPTDLEPGGVLAAADASTTTLRAAFVLLVGGFAVKAAMAPIHGWLPQAMVAPAPVSALLHAVAVVKAGAFGIVRTVYDLYGIELTSSLGLLRPLAIAAAATIVWGSLQALRATDLKPLLAWSTVSQVSYIILGVALLGPLGTIGGLAHLVHQGLMKVTLFFCAGAFERRAGAKRLDQLDGLGTRMPWTAAAFTVGALGMIGLPPVAGFVSKWYLGLGALEADAGWALAILLLSTVLNAWYFLPVLRRLWFADARAPLRPAGDARWVLVAPACVTAVLAVVVGTLPETDISPVAVARAIADEVYP